MEKVISYFQNLQLDYWLIAKTAGVLILGVLLISVLARFIFGKKSIFNSAVSTTIGILFVFAVTVVLKSLGVPLGDVLAPLPYVSITADSLILFSFAGADYTVICTQILSMIILAFLMGLLDGWLPKGKNPIVWLFFRCLSVAGALVLHWVVTYLFNRFLPEGLVTYAPTILLAVLVLMLATGALKLLVGAIMATVNPLIAALYTFFFANFVGKQVTKAVLSALLLSCIVLLLQYFGVGVISIAAASLIAYIPFVILLVLLWYLVYKAL